MKPHSRFPISTYRLQFNREFTFCDAAKLVPYLAQLGISHCYASPYLRARPGSMHGYDIIDHNALNPEIGTPEDYDHFVSELHRHGMGQILDIVPNHMGVMGSDNSWWLDVLENGQASTFAEFFDIDWDPIKDELQGKVLVPILGDQYGNVLENGELKLTFDVERGEFSIYYHQHRFPINPVEYPRILGFRIQDIEEKLGPTHDDVLELQSIKTAFSHLPTSQNITPEKMAERTREREVQKRRLAALCARSVEIKTFLEAHVQILNGTVGEPRSFDALHELIKAQSYRLAQWRVAADDINYRRFFDINDLAALRTENETVLNLTHRFTLSLVSQGKVDGLRIDHPDGLYDPAKYFQDLQAGMPSAAGDDSGQTQGRNYVVVEKILTGNEKLRKDWPVQGTTGYEFANLVNGVFVDPSAAMRAERIYRSFTGQTVEFEDLVYACKKLILKVALASELNVLANALSRIALSNRHTCDFTVNSLRSALGEVIASFPVYRTYVSSAGVSPEDRRYIERAVAVGRKRSNAADLSVFDFIRRMLLIETNGEPQWYRRAITAFAMKFQQVTSAVMAKGLEDTSFYRYNRLVSLNEVGGDPQRFGIPIAEFHEANQRRAQCWPYSMVATSTHDSKRSEDVRARIDVLSEMPAAWRLSLRRWRDWNRGRKRIIDERPAPSRNDEYLFYQTLIGAWPLERLDDSGWQKFVSRIEQYMLKAVREAKEFTSWANPNTEYEDALTEFTQATLDRRRRNRFLSDFGEFQRRISRMGMFNSISQTLLKLTVPGLPDIYQGNELWDFSLVDPDNRRPVDYARRQQLLQELIGWGKAGADQQWEALRGLLESLEDGRAKLYVTWKTLCLRQEHSEVFQKGGYTPLSVNGARADHVCGFARHTPGEAIIVAVPRLCATLLGEKRDTPIGSDVWGDTRIELPGEIPHFAYQNIFTRESVPTHDTEGAPSFAAGDLFKDFPVVLLCSHS
jgi:(1->4)-alpha-D-glucan 1-alpha-D-glucosylmutase